MPKEFQQHHWGKPVELELQRLLEIAVSEDVEMIGDLTSRALVPESAMGAATVHAREDGIAAGVKAVETIVNAIDSKLLWQPLVDDGTPLSRNVPLGTVSGPARSLLTAERLILNFLSRLSGIATLTRCHVDAISGTGAHIYDTRKTTPGWRLLEKFAVRCGGGRNHRTGLYDALLIKDNHLAFGREGNHAFRPAEAVFKARDFLKNLMASKDILSVQGAGNLVIHQFDEGKLPIIEIEVDTLEQLEDVLPSNPDIVLLDNMESEQLVRAVAMRNKTSLSTQLEASGGVHLKTVRAIAETGVERISVGALTHSAVALDLGLDWKQTDQ